MARLKEIVIDYDIPSRVAGFWAQVLDDYEIAPYDDAELARLAALGLTPETDPVVMVEGPGPASVSISVRESAPLATAFISMSWPPTGRRRWRGSCPSVRPSCGRRRATPS